MESGLEIGRSSLPCPQLIGLISHPGQLSPAWGPGGIFISSVCAQMLCTQAPHTPQLSWVLPTCSIKAHVLGFGYLGPQIWLVFLGKDLTD